MAEVECYKIFNSIKATRLKKSELRMTDDETTRRTPKVLSIQVHLTRAPSYRPTHGHTAGLDSTIGGSEPCVKHIWRPFQPFWGSHGSLSIDWKSEIRSDHLILVPIPDLITLPSPAKH